MNLRLFKQGVVVLLVTSSLMLSGCASIVSKSSYPISINSTPSGAKVTIKDRRGMDIYSGNTPTYIKLSAGAGFFTKANYIVTFEMDGYEKRSVPVEYGIDGWYFGNILFGGLIGMLIVDPATGAMWKLETEFIHETLSKTAATVEVPSLKVLSYNDIPDEMKDKLVRVR